MPVSTTYRSSPTGPGRQLSPARALDQPSQGRWEVQHVDYLPHGARSHVAIAERAKAAEAGRYARKVPAHTMPTCRGFSTRAAADDYAAQLRRQLPDTAVRVISVKLVLQRVATEQLDLDDWPICLRPDDGGLTP